MITFRVKCTIQNNITIKLVGRGDILGNWEPSKAIGLYRGSDVGEYTQWHAKILAEVGWELEYKFVKESNNESELSWESSPNHIFTVKRYHENSEVLELEWEGARKIT